MLERSARWDNLDRSRPVAKTDRPRFRKARAKAEPIPPALQPVMRTELMVIVGEEGWFDRFAWRGGIGELRRGEKG